MVNENKNFWSPDVLGENFQQICIPIVTQQEQKLCATLVRYRPDRVGSFFYKAKVLYLHGWSDYFFQKELAAFWQAQNVAFYALDLRNYGRSLLDQQIPGFVENLEVYDTEIFAALEIMNADLPENLPLIFMGHSTGGLVLSLLVKRYPGLAVALVLNSPWLEFQGKMLGRKMLKPLLDLGSHYKENSVLPGLDLGFYGKTVSKNLSGRWDYNLAWRPEKSFQMSVATLISVLDGHEIVKNGLDIGVPILVLLSNKSLLSLFWSEEMFYSDVVIDVEVISHRAISLGNFVTIAKVVGALHDVFLSEKLVRDEAYMFLGRWLKCVL